MPIKYTKEFLEKACKESTSYRQVLILSERCPDGGGNIKLLKEKIKEFNIDISHFTGQSWRKEKSLGGKEKYQLKDILVKDSKISQKTLRDYVIKYNVIEYKCAFCGNIGNWLNQKISLELDHINGINNDNRQENLRWLCPNCHSITDTYCGKNKKAK